MITSNIFNAANKLKDIKVVIGGVVFVNELIPNIELSYKNDSPKITGELIFKDLYDMNLQISWEDATVNISYIDIFDSVFRKSFKILSIHETLNKNKEKITVLSLQDIYSYTIERSYLSKSYSGNIIQCINEYLDELGITTDIIPRDFVSSDLNINFAVPLNKNYLDFLLIELQKNGLNFYQNNEALVIKDYESLLPNNLEENDNGEEYLTETDNQLYKNKLYEIIPSHKNRTKTPKIADCITYNPLEKRMVKLSEEFNLNDVQPFILNNDDVNIQDSIGTSVIYQYHENFEDIKLKYMKDFLQEQEIIIIINGYFKNDLNQIYNLKIHGQKGSYESMTKGNKILSGKWISTKKVDKFVGFSMIQKITLNRKDMVLK